MTFSAFIPVAIYHLTLVIWPTTNMLYMLSILARYSFREVIKFIIGIAIADAVYVIISVYGLNEFKNLSQNIQLVLQLIGVTIFFLLGLRITLHAKKFIQTKPEEVEIEIKKEHFTIQGFILTLINPKAMLLYPIVLSPLLKHGLTEIDRLLVSAWFIFMTPLYVVIMMCIVNRFVKTEKVHGFLFKTQRWLGVLLMIAAVCLAVRALVKYCGM